MISRKRIFIKGMWLTKTFCLCLFLLLQVNFSIYPFEEDQEEFVIHLPPLSEETQLISSAGLALWREFKEAQNTQAKAEQKKAFKSLLRWKRESGYDGLPTLSGAMAHKAAGALKNLNDKELAESLLMQSVDLDPINPSNYFALANVALRRFHFLEAGGFFIRGCTAFIKSIAGMYYLTTNFLFLFACALFTIGMVFVATSFLRYYPCLKHDFIEFFHKSDSPDMLIFILWVLLFLPLFLGIGLLWTLIFCLVLFFQYMQKREKAVTLIIMILIALTNPWLDLTYSFYNNYATPYVQTSLGLVRNGYNPELIKQLEMMLEANPEDLESRYFLASLYEEGGKYHEALAEYYLILDKDPMRYHVYLHIGNIFFRMNQNDLAIENYKRSTSINPGYAPAYYNASIVYSKNFNFEKAAECKRAALKNDANILAYAEEEKIFMNRPTSGMIRERIWEKIKAGFYQAAHMETVQTTHDKQFLFLGGNTLVPGLSFLSLLILIYLARRNGVVAVICRKCGNVFCKKCQNFSGPERFCSPCYHLFIKRDGIAPDAQKIKISNIHRYLKRKKLTVSLLTACIPGSGHLYYGRTVTGLLIMLVWSLSIAYLIFRNSLLTYPTKATGGGIPILVVVSFFLLALMYLLANLTIHLRGKD